MDEEVHIQLFDAFEAITEGLNSTATESQLAETITRFSLPHPQGQWFPDKKEGIDFATFAATILEEQPPQSTWQPHSTTNRLKKTNEIQIPQKRGRRKSSRVILKSKDTPNGDVLKRGKYQHIVISQVPLQPKQIAVSVHAVPSFANLKSASLRLMSTEALQLLQAEQAALAQAASIISAFFKMVTQRRRYLRMQARSAGTKQYTFPHFHDCEGLQPIGNLRVMVLDGSALSGLPRYTDAYVDVSMKFNPHYLSGVKHKSLDPKWGETFILKVYKLPITLAIWVYNAHYDTDDLVGMGLFTGINNLVSRLATVVTVRLREGGEVRLQLTAEGFGHERMLPPITRIVESPTVKTSFRVSPSPPKQSAEPAASLHTTQPETTPSPVLRPVPTVRPRPDPVRLPQLPATGVLASDSHSRLHAIHESLDDFVKQSTKQRKYKLRWNTYVPLYWNRLF